MGAIRRLTGHLNPPSKRVSALPKPTEVEKIPSEIQLGENGFRDLMIRFAKWKMVPSE
ncbi:MAG: hypothetical protein O7F12_00820 [Nitrospirae bacterium]|nr:hypothetical protein [Nitrospirota bacterium]